MRNLSVLNRILILSVLPKEGDLLTIKMLKNLKDKLNFSENEVKEFELRFVEGGNFIWNSTKAIDIEYELTDGEMKLISDGLKEVAKSKKLTEQHLELCEMFGIE